VFTEFEDSFDIIAQASYLLVVVLAQKNVNFEWQGFLYEEIQIQN
jgi:hypothetical protein